MTVTLDGMNALCHGRGCSKRVRGERGVTPSPNFGQLIGRFISNKVNWHMIEMRSHDGMQIEPKMPLFSINSPDKNKEIRQRKHFCR